MGTRADFYLGTDPAEMTWLGSIAWDGYPEGIESAILSAQSSAFYQEAVSDMLSTKDDATHPEDGWPWPWENSRVTDYAYTFDGERVLYSHFGSPWRAAIELKGEDLKFPQVEFPDMAGVQKVVMSGKRSGLIVVGNEPDGEIVIK